MSVYGKHKLTTYYKKINKQYLTLSLRSRSALWKKWRVEFGEEFDLTYSALKQWVKTTKQTSPKEERAMFTLATSDSSVANKDVSSLVNEPIAMFKYANSDVSVANKELADLHNEVSVLISKIESHPCYEHLLEDVKLSLDDYKERLNINSLVEPVPEPSIEPRFPPIKSVKILEPIFSNMEVYLGVDYNSFEDDSDSEMLKQNSVEVVIKERDFELSPAIPWQPIPTYRWPESYQVKINHDLTNKIEENIKVSIRENIKVNLTPIYIQGLVELPRIYLTSSVLSTLVKAYPNKRKIRKSEEFNSEFSWEPLSENAIVEYNAKDEYISPTSPSYPKLKTIEEEEINVEEEDDIDLPREILIEVDPIPELSLVPYINPPVVFACPEARTEVRRSREPNKQLPKEYKGRNEKSHLSNRLHWPCNLDDRKGMYIHMLLKYTPLYNKQVSYDYIIWIIYSYTVPDEIDEKEWNNKRDDIDDKLKDICRKTWWNYPHVNPSGDLSVFEREMQSISDDGYRLLLDMRKIWNKQLKVILEQNKWSRLDEIEDYMEHYKQLVEDLKKRFKLAKKKKNQLILEAAAEPVLEKENKDPDPDPQYVVDPNTIILGNIEQYMYENNLSDADFEEEGLELVGGMRPLIPNLNPGKMKKWRRKTPEEEAREQNENRRRIFELQTHGVPSTTSVTGSTQYYQSEGFSLTPLDRPLSARIPLTNEQLRFAGERRARLELGRSRERRKRQEQAALRRRERGLVMLPRAVPEDQISPLSPERSPPAPEPSIEPRFPIDVPEEDEAREGSFNPFADLLAPDEMKQAQPLRREDFDPFNQIHGPIDIMGGVQPQYYEDEEEFVEDPYQPAGWTVRLGKPRKQVTFIEDPETGRYILPPKKKIGRPRKEVPPTPPGKKKQYKRKMLKVNSLGQLEEVEILERGIGRREFERRQSRLQEQIQEIARSKRTKESELIYNRAVALNIDGLSDHLSHVYRRVVKIRRGLKIAWFGYSIDAMKRIAQGPNFSLDEFATSSLFTPLQMFQRQTIQLQDFVRRSAERQISMWRFVMIYTSANGQHVTSTTWAGDYQRAYAQAQWKITELMGRYGEDGITLDRFEIRIRVVPRQTILAGGRETILDKKMEELKNLWTVVNPTSKTNCLWTSVAIASGYIANPQLIYNHRVQNRAGIKLKQTVGTRNYKGGTEEDLQKCANHKKTTIVVHDIQDKILATITPTNNIVSNGSIHVMLNVGHYHALLSNTDKIVKENKTQMVENKQRQLEVIKKCEKEFKERRIAVYDLESYRKPIREENGVIEEVDQIAYAIGWAIEIQNIEEWTKMEELGYEVIEAKLDNETYNLAYKRILGEECMNEAIHEWTHNKIFDQCVMYAHNGGKFDVRLILGQSNLLYDSKYKLVPEKTIELNGRIINMDIQNLFMEYEEISRKGKTFKRFHQISIRDSLPLFGPDSKLAKLTTELNVQHKKMEELINVHDLQNIETWRGNWEKYEMDKYLRNDVLGLLEVLIKFNKEVTEGTGIPISCINTGASLAKKYYLKHHYNNISEENIVDPSLSIYSLPREMDEFIRLGYGGGRCEAFRCGEIDKNVYYYDFTSLYPDVGRLPMPIGQPKWLTNPGTEEENNQQIKNIWTQRVINGQTFNTTAFWKVRVRSPNVVEGNTTSSLVRKPLYGMQEDGMYVFRWYKQWTEQVIYEEEIRFAIENKLDYEYEPINAITFQKGEVLKSCMEHLFKKKAEAKEQGKPGLSKTWKIIINSLYGVWGLKILDREGIEIARPEDSNWAIDLATEKLKDIEKIGKYVVTRRIKDLEVKDCNVAIAAAVTSEARMKLYRLIMDIQNNGGEVLYCDTDSIITDYSIEGTPLEEKWMGPSKGKELGTLKNEIEECYEKLQKKQPNIQFKDYFDKAIIVAPKLYIVTAENGKIVKKANKGYKEDAEKGDIVDYNRMKILVDKTIPETERILEQDTNQWLGGNADILKNNIGVRIVKRHKTIQGIRADGHPINKGILREDGIVEPYIDRQ